MIKCQNPICGHEHYEDGEGIEINGEMVCVEYPKCKCEKFEVEEIYCTTGEGKKLHRKGVLRQGECQECDSYIRHQMKNKDGKKLKDCRSNCCDAAFIHDTDICRKCEEHAEPIGEKDENNL